MSVELWVLHKCANRPFVPDVVNFMEGYTKEAHALNIQVKYYYTIRELTNHVAELYALKSLQGEVLTSGDPYTIPQARHPFAALLAYDHVLLCHWRICLPCGG
jgi:hypothetical protein